VIIDALKMFYKKYGKRFFDISVILITAPIIFPLILLISLIVMYFNGTPIFYKAERVGMNYKLFTMYKFRTMHLNLEKKLGDTTGYNDPRINFIGSYLRRFKLDELPQLFNVLMGNMSLVGPRPEMEYYYKEFYNENDLKVLSVKPGITDFFSIEYSSLDNIVGSENPESFFQKNLLRKKINLRVKYVNEISFYTDLKMLFNTMLVLLKKFFKK
tara:strand:+ start:1387 stop:2028 length:642 start_codon:yes stop_codon:yes gene_type:complete